MNPLSRVLAWADAHRAEALDLVRVYLGLGLFVRGVLFLTDSQAYLDLLPGSGGAAFGSMAILHYVALAHLCFGLLLAAGLLTRLAALIQLPILLGAVLFIHLDDGLLAADQSLEFATLVLFLLAVFAVMGSGPWSLDRYLARRMEETEAAEDAIIEATARRLHEPPRAADREALPAAGLPAPPKEVITFLAASETCACGHDLDHPDVIVERRYRFPSAMTFFLGVTATPASVAFRCRACGEVIAESRDPAVRRRYRYKQHPGPA